MKDYLNIGPCPPGEESVQVAEGGQKMKAECRRYIDLIRKFLGEEPAGARLTIKGFDHDFGVYYEVVCHYDDELPESVKYALKCEGEGPDRWGAVIHCGNQPPYIVPLEDEDALY